MSAWQGGIALRFRLLLAASVAAFVCLATGPAPAASASTCPDYLFLGATGSGGNEAAPSNYGMGLTIYRLYQQVHEQLLSQPETNSLALTPEGVGYPAAGVLAPPWTTLNLLDDINGAGALLHIGPLGNYHASVLEGTEQAIEDVNTFVSRCGSTGAKVILAGYSQGAQALADAIEGKPDKAGTKMDTSALVGAAFFGDPYFNPKSGADEGDFDPGRHGLLGKRGEYPSPLMFPERRIHSFCRNKDPICQGLMSSSLISFPDFDLHRHEVYAKEGSTAAAAVELENLIRDDQAMRGNPVPDPVPTTISGPLDVVFAIDTTGSMGDLIGGVKSDVKNIVSQLAALDSDYRVALVDYKDGPPYCSDPYQAKVDQSFTTDESSFDVAVEELFAEGGCDTPESVYTGMMTALELPWRTGAHKILIAMGDAGGHPTDPVTGFTAADVISKALSLDPVAVYGLVGHGSSEAQETFGELAEATGGETRSIENAEKVPGAIHDAITASATAPTANAGGPYTGYVDTPTELTAAGSGSPIGRKLTYEWDTNNDGVYDMVTEDPVTSATWSAPYSGAINLRITDSKGLVGLAQTSVLVSGTAPLPPAAPSAPTLTAGDGEVKASWMPASTGGPVGYYILRDSNEDPVLFAAPNGEGRQTAAIPELPNGLPIALDAAAVNISGESPLSPLSAFVTPVAPELAGATLEPPKSGGTTISGGVKGSKETTLPVPVISGFRESSRRWWPGHKLAAISVAKTRRTVGTVFSFGLNGDASVMVTFVRRLTGVRSGHRCVTRRRHGVGGKACEQEVPAGTLTFHGHPGLNKLAFQGRLSATKRLHAGGYNITISATNVQNARSAPASLRFAILGG